MRTVWCGFHFLATVSAIPALGESLRSSVQPGPGLDLKHSLVTRPLWARRLARLPSVPTGRDVTCAALRDAGSAWVARAELAASCQSRIKISVGVAVDVVMKVAKVYFDIARLELCSTCLR